MRNILFATVFTASVYSSLAFAGPNFAIVNGVALPQSRYEAVVKSMNQNTENIDEKTKRAIKENLIASEILRQEALKKGMDKSAIYLMHLTQLKDQLLVRTFVEDFIKNHPISDTNAKKEFDKIKAGLANKEYQLRHILVKDEETAKNIIAQLRKGAKFETLAKEKSIDANSAVQGGELGWAAVDNYVPEFAEAVKKMPKGKISDTPIKTEFGWHIIQVEDIRLNKGPVFNEIKAELIRQMQGELLKKHVAELTSKAKISES